MRKNQSGITGTKVLLIVVVLVLIAVIGFHIRHTKTAAAKPTNTASKVVKLAANTNGQVIDGTAYLSPNKGEGLSIQYLQIISGTVYHPFIPLQNSVDPATIIANKAARNIQIKAIKIGDKLEVDESQQPAVSAASSSQASPQLKIYSIQDLSR